VGAAGVFMGAAHHNQLAAVIADDDSVVHRLSAASLGRMKEEDPGAALAFQEFVIHYLAERLAKHVLLVEHLLTYSG